MGMIKLTGPVQAYAGSSGWKLEKYPQAADAVKSGKVLVEETVTVPTDTIVKTGDKLVSGYDMTNKQAVSLHLVAEEIPGVVNKGEYLLFTKASNSKYTPPPKLSKGDFGPPHKWQLLVDNLKVHADEDLSSKVIGKLKKGKVYTLQQVAGAEPMHRCVEAKGFVAIADPKTGKFFWNLLAGDGKVIDLNKEPSKAPVKPKKETGSGSGFGLGSEPSTPSYTPESDKVSISTTTVLMIVGGAVLAFMLLTPPGGARKRARA